MQNDFLQIVKTGVNITTAGTSANSPIPTDSANTIPKYVRLSATAACYVKIGVGSGTAAVAGDMLINPADGVVVGTCGGNYIAALQVTTGGILQVSPVENS
jgi:hypothetical protein